LTSVKTLKSLLDNRVNGFEERLKGLESGRLKNMENHIAEVDKKVSRKGLGFSSTDDSDQRRVLREAAGKWFLGKFAKRADLVDQAYMAMGISKAAFQEDVSTEGGFLVPKPLADEVLRLVAPIAAVRPIARVIPMTSKTLDLPNFATEPTSAIVGEEAVIPDAVPANPMGQVTMTAKKIASLFTLSLEVFDDSIVSLGDLLLLVIAEKIAKIEDAQALEGDGAGQNFTGVLSASGVGTVNVGAALTNLDPFVTALYGTLPYEAQPNTTWIMHPKTWAAILKLKDTQNRYQVNPVPLGAPELSLLGKPVRLTDQILTNRGAGNDTHVYVGDFQRGLIIGDRLLQTLQLNPYSKFGTGQIDGRILERVGIVVGIGKAFVKVTNITV
jgi:HK97 family phage major capsid protein